MRSGPLRRDTGWVCKPKFTDRMGMAARVALRKWGYWEMGGIVIT